MTRGTKTLRDCQFYMLYRLRTCVCVVVVVVPECACAPRIELLQRLMVLLVCVM